jgi:hypothetical protein
MNAHSRSLWRERPSLRVPDEIHPVWCTCSDCQIAAHRALRFDLVAIALGVVGALVALTLDSLGLL